ncbi:MAG TPA: type I 3-dehydroquinate dehydratase [Thermoanaerobaculia bacterium]|nr:type I 3-dehydroquinate dehydratase [Thermoanaerobaculia bacterium]
MDRTLPIPATIATLAPASFEDARRLAALVPPEANAIEWRLDLAPGRISPRALLDLDPRCAIVTYRTVREGGRFAGSADEYRRSVVSAYEAGAVVDVELESGLLGDAGFLPDRSRVIGSRHGPSLSEGRLRACVAHDVAAVKLVLTDPDTVAEAIGCVERARRLSRERPVACFATGTRGAVTRVLAPRFGSALTYGTVDGSDATGAGQISLGELRAVYRAGETAPPERLFAVYGGDVSGSLSPRIHNELFRRRGLPWLYVPLTASRRGAARESPIAGDLIALDGLSRNLHGVSVTNPFKGDFAGVAEPDADTSRIGAANTLVRRKPECLDLSAHNTDLRAAREALGRLGGARVMVVGTGGAARAALAAASSLGRAAAVAGRDRTKTTLLAAEFEADAVDMSELASKDADVWVNATPLGSGDDDPMPVPVGVLRPGAAVVDFVYRRDGETALARETRARGAALVDGLELLARQAAGQAALFGVPDATFEEIDAILRGDS